MTPLLRYRLDDGLSAPHAMDVIDAPLSPARRSRTRFWIMYASAWVPLALVYAAIHVSQQRGEGYLDSVVAATVSVGIAAVLGVGVWLLTAGLEGVSRRWLIALAHAVAGVAYSLLWIAGITLRILLQGGAGDASAYLASPGTGWQVLSGLWVYGGLAGVFHAVRAQRREEEHRRALAAAELRRAQSEASRVTAELRAIRARLDPHFFFNTLQALLPLVKQAPDEAQSALERFGNMMRYLLHEQGGDGTTTLDAELRFVRDYLALEALRLGDRLRVREQIDRTALDARVPALTLQPLVENAIVHGIAPRANGGTLDISVERIGERIVIRITDDGPGITSTSIEAARGVGLRAVRERLAFAYAGRATLQVDTAPDAGFTVTIELPEDEDPVASPPAQRADADTLAVQ